MSDTPEGIVQDDQVRVSVVEARAREQKAVLEMVQLLSDGGSPDIAKESRELFDDDGLPDGAPIVRMALATQDSSRVLTRREMRERKEGAKPTKSTWLRRSSAE